ncbi:MAG: IPExxxVDY family protein [Bacteroidota bacterium]
MGPKKKILRLDDSFLEPEELLWMITSTNDDYRMAYFFNKNLKFRFYRYTTLDYKLPGKKLTGAYSVYVFEQEGLPNSWYLLSNKHENGNLIKKSGNVDFLLIARGTPDAVEVDDITSRIRQFPETLFVQHVDPDKLDNIGEVLDLLEIKMIEVKKERKKNELAGKNKM